MLREIVTVFVFRSGSESLQSAKIQSSVKAKSDVQRICGSGIHDFLFYMERSGPGCFDANICVIGIALFFFPVKQKKTTTKNLMSKIEFYFML